jgi:hypothetical protein
VEYDLTSGEDLFLSYTWELENGPPIIRDGEGPPFMQVIGGLPKQTTTHPFGLRLGTWLIRDDMRNSEIEAAQELLQAATAQRSDPAVVDVLQRTVSELPSIKSHNKVFSSKYRDYEIIGQQGCGDLTMNYWNVAYINNKLSKRYPTKPSLVYLRDEKLDLRTYPCLVKWKPVAGRRPRFTIEGVRFQPWNDKTGANHMAWVRFGDSWLPRGDLIEFAVSSQQVIRYGEIVPSVLNSAQFSDLRHLIQMPNINPPRPLHPGEPTQARTYFTTQREGDIWFGEQQFLQDEPRNLLRAALHSPVLLEFVGVGDLRLRGALEQAGYREIQDELVPLTPGTWRFVPRSPHVDVVDIFFKRNVYGWTMVGLSEDNNRLLCLACTGRPGRVGYKLEEAAQILLGAGAWNALLMDEGADVFQLMLTADGQLTPMVSSERRRLRATFIMARQRSSQSRSEEASHKTSPSGRRRGKRRRRREE